MSLNGKESVQSDVPASGWQPIIFRFVVMVAVLLIIIPIVPMLISNLIYSFSGGAPKIYWYLSRAGGFVTLSVLWVSMALGLGITNKMARLWPGAPTAFAVHQFTSLLGLAFATYHGLVLIGDHFTDFSLPRLVIPFSIAYKTIWIGLGQMCFYVWLLVVLSFYVRRFIGQKIWRLIHFINFVTYIMGFLHALMSGTDSTTGWARGYFWISGLSIIALLIYRIYDSKWKGRISVAALGLKWPSRMPTPVKASAPVVAARTRNIPQALIREQLRRPEKELAQSVAEEKTAVHTPKPAGTPATPATEIRATATSPVVRFQDAQRVRVRIFKESGTEDIVDVLPESFSQTTQLDGEKETHVLEQAHLAKLNPVRTEEKAKAKARTQVFSEPITLPIPELREKVGIIQSEMQSIFERVRQNFRLIPVEPTTPGPRTRMLSSLDD